MIISISLCVNFANQLFQISFADLGPDLLPVNTNTQVAGVFQE